MGKDPRRRHQANITIPDGITPQAGLVFGYMRERKDRKLTPLAAHMFLGIASLTARIAELRGKGVAIKDKWEEDEYKRRFKAYWLDHKYWELPATNTENVRCAAPNHTS